jgi:ribosomal protein S12 methylthiotransferase accessory factor YcaO
VLQSWTAGEACHSCHLRFSDYPLLAANGKGVTPDLARASAYAEFMERLQCRADSYFTRAGNIHQLPPLTASWPRTALEVVADAPELAARDLRALGSLGSSLLSCVPLADVFGGRAVALPLDLLRFLTGTSGMCAGNTPEEALCHGICEVFERHAIHALNTGRVEGFPTLPLDRLPLASPVVERQVRDVLAAGVDVVVTLATLGGAFPVLAVVLTERRSGKPPAAARRRR